MDDKIIYAGVVKRENDIARLHIYHREMFNKDIERLAGKKVEVTVRPRRKHRGEDISEQRRRLWETLDRQWQNYLMIVKRGIKIK